MTIKAIVFDLDNTLIDFVKLKDACVSASVDAMIAKGLGISKQEAVKLIFELYHEYGWEYQHIFDKFLEVAKGKVDYKLLATGILAYRKARSETMKPYANVVPTLKKLKSKGIKLVILSDAPRLQAHLRLAELNLIDFFDIIVTFDDTGRRKPNPAPFKKALEALAMKPQEVLMIGDWPERDIAGAKAVGMRTALAKYGLMPNINPEPKADFEISNISELLKII